jgi:PEP-CTERM motif
MLKASAILLVLTTASLSAAAIDINASARGWVCTPVITNGSCPVNNNAADPQNNYIAGASSFSNGTNRAQFRNWFEFAIPDLLSGESLVSATLSLDVGGHSGGALTFAVYGLQAEPLVFPDVTTSNPFGSIATSDASTGTTLNITLNGAALAAIAAKQGGNLFIGGINSGENVQTSPGFDFSGDFNSTDETDDTVLHLATASIVDAMVPEPNSMLLLAASLGALGIAIRKRRRQPYPYRA